MQLDSVLTIKACRLEDVFTVVTLNIKTNAGHLHPPLQFSNVRHSVVGINHKLSRVTSSHASCPSSCILMVATMEALKAQIVSKRKNLEESSELTARPSKYMRKGDIEKLRLQQEREKADKETREQLENGKNKDETQAQIVRVE